MWGASRLGRRAVAATLGTAAGVALGHASRCKADTMPVKPSPIRGLRNADVLLMADAELEPAPRRFEGKTILITGAGGSFGREGARYFAAEGANVIAIDMGATALEETRKAVLQTVPSARCVTAVCDVRDRVSVYAMVDAGIAAFGSIDLCWNNAGVQGKMTPTLDYPADDFQQVLDSLHPLSSPHLCPVSKCEKALSVAFEYDH